MKRTSVKQFTQQQSPTPIGSLLKSVLKRLPATGEERKTAGHAFLVSRCRRLPTLPAWEHASLRVRLIDALDSENPAPGYARIFRETIAAIEADARASVRPRGILYRKSVVADSSRRQTASKRRSLPTRTPSSLRQDDRTPRLH